MRKEKGMDLFKKAVNSILFEQNLITEDFGSSGKFEIWHCTQEKVLKSIGNVGFERAFTGKNSNYYGPGTYTTYDLESSINNSYNGPYGPIILHGIVKSLRNFLIATPSIAKKVYKTENIDFQLKKILPRDLYERFKTENPSLYGELIRPVAGDNDRTAPRFRALWLWLSGGYSGQASDLAAKINPLIDGFIFHGSADGSVAVIRSYDNIYPIEISYDHGKTFKPFNTSGHFEDFAKNDVDLKWRLMKLGMYNDFDKCPDYFTDGFARVKKNGKYNYLYRKNYTHGVISPDVWFDSAPPTFDKQGIARVQINGEKIFIKLQEEPNTFHFFVYDDDGDYICKLKELPLYLQKISQMGNYEDDDDF